MGDRKAWRIAFHEAGHVVANLMADSVMVEARIFSEGSKSYKRGLRGETIHYYVWNRSGMSQHQAAVSGYAGAIAVHFQNKPIASDYKLRWLMPLIQADLSPSDWSDIPMDPSASWKAASDCLRLLRKNWMSVELIANALMQEMVRHRPALMPRIQFLPVAF